MTTKRKILVVLVLQLVGNFITVRPQYGLISVEFLLSFAMENSIYELCSVRLTRIILLPDRLITSISDDDDLTMEYYTASSTSSYRNFLIVDHDVIELF